MPHVSRLVEISHKSASGTGNFMQTASNHVATVEKFISLDNKTNKPSQRFISFYSVSIRLLLPFLLISHCV